MAWVETMKKTDVEMGRQNGNVDYNWGWPATRIFKELYVREVVNKGKD